MELLSGRGSESKLGSSSSMSTSKKVVLEGMSQSRASYERFANAFSNVRAGDEAQERASKSIATDLKARVAAFLSTVQS